MSVNHDQIVNSVKQVVQFFSEARCVSGSKINSKSKSLVHKPDIFKDSPSDDILHFWEEVKKYESERDQTKCLVIGCYGIVAAQCISGVRSAVVLITSDLCLRLKIDTLFFKLCNQKAIDQKWIT